MMFSLLKARRSVRKYHDREVEKDKLDIILKSALLSPSSRSIRPWEFIAVNDKGLLRKLSRCRDHGAAFLEGAPLGIVVIADPGASDVWIEDASIAAIIIHLTAQSMGLGSCWIQIRERFYNENEKAEDYIKGILGIPEKYHIESIIAIGYPFEEKRPYDESRLMYQKLHLNKFGMKI
jgi:nitroreductase